MSITYKWVLEIRQIISNNVCVEYQEKETVYPSQLQDHLFTIVAIDNIDHNLTSATAQSLFHGTTISIFQDCAVPISSPPFRLNTTKAYWCTKLSLPESFTEIRPTLEFKAETPKLTSLTVSGNQKTSVLNEADTWLAVLGKAPEENIKTHFSAFYSHGAMLPINTGSLLLPLIPEPVTVSAIGRHAVNIVHKITQKVNPGQISIIRGDQPVYAIGKQLQWMLPT